MSHFAESVGGPSSSAWKSLQQLGLVGDTLRVWAASQATRAQALSGRVASLCTSGALWEKPQSEWPSDLSTLVSLLNSKIGEPLGAAQELRALCAGLNTLRSSSTFLPGVTDCLVASADTCDRQCAEATTTTQRFVVHIALLESKLVSGDATPVLEQLSAASMTRADIHPVAAFWAGLPPLAPVAAATAVDTPQQANPVSTTQAQATQSPTPAVLSVEVPSPLAPGWVRQGQVHGRESGRGRERTGWDRTGQGETGAVGNLQCYHRCVCV